MSRHQYDNQWNKSNYASSPGSGTPRASWFTKIPCGKHEGRTWADILKEDPEYIKELAEKRYIHGLYVPEIKYPKGSEFYLWIVQNLKIDVPENIPYGKAKEYRNKLRQEAREKAGRVQMPFGTHKGMELCRIERSYLEWVVNTVKDGKWKYLVDACKVLVG